MDGEFENCVIFARSEADSIYVDGMEMFENCVIFARSEAYCHWRRQCERFENCVIFARSEIKQPIFVTKETVFNSTVNDILKRYC